LEEAAAEAVRLAPIIERGVEDDSEAEEEAEAVEFDTNAGAVESIITLPTAAAAAADASL
jgi:hypothetical protein